MATPVGNTNQPLGIIGPRGKSSFSGKLLGCPVTEGELCLACLTGSLSYYNRSEVVQKSSKSRYFSELPELSAVIPVTFSALAAYQIV